MVHAVLSWSPVETDGDYPGEDHVQLDFHDLIFDSDGVGVCEVDWTNQECGSVVLHMDTIVRRGGGEGGEA